MRTVDLLIVLHVQEGIIIKVAEELDVRLNAPVVFVVLQELVTIEEL
jgi:hypothetical protein